MQGKSLAKMGKVYIGPAGWNYKDWEGIVYPASKKEKFDQLAYLARLFNTIEINSSFYRPPSIQTAMNWVRRIKVNPEFNFTYKLWQAYTHERHSFPGKDKEKLVKPGLDILKSHNRLGAVLIQFPWSFKNTTENQHWLKQVITLFKEYNPVVEIRHSSWKNEKFFKFLNDSGAAFANIDQPVIGDSIGLSAIGSKTIGYLRLHGRNFDNWFAKDATATSRYDYLYSEDELDDIKAVITKITENSPKTFIIFNNHFRGQAVANALQTMFLMEGKAVNAPARLIKTYPNLEKISKSEDLIPEQTSLF